MRVTPIAAAVLLGLGGLVAQESDYAKLKAEFDAATASYRSALRVVAQTEEYKTAAASRDTQTINALRAKVPQVDNASFVVRFQAVAEKLAGDEAAVPPLLWLVQGGSDREAARAAATTLTTAHLSSAGLQPLVEEAYFLSRHYTPAEASALLATIAEGSPHAMVRAHAMYAQARGLMRRDASDADRAKAPALLAEAEKLAEGTELAWTIQGPTFEKENLQIGMTAPDIAGEDLDGVPFKLSDYRGKVVVLDFWGDW